MSNIQWYDQIFASFGFRIASDGERDAFYEEIRLATGAKNDEIVEAVRQASIDGIKPDTQYGRVAASDVIKWIRRYRKAATVSGYDQESYKISQFIATNIKALNDGYTDLELVEREAFFYATDAVTQDDIVSAIKNGMNVRRNWVQ